MIIRLVSVQLITLLLVACVQESISQTEESIYFKGPDQCKDCSDCVYIPSSIEPDTLHAKLISAYFVSALQGEDLCAEFSTVADKEELYQKSSLVDAIAHAYLKGVKMPKSFGETYFSDHKIELLFHIEDEGVLHEVADTLLSHNEADGLMAIWDTLDTTKLGHFEKYYNEMLSSDNIFLVAELAVSMHLNGYAKEEEELLTRAKALSDGFEEQYSALKKLLLEPTFDYSEYVGKIYYGN